MKIWCVIAICSSTVMLNNKLPPPSPLLYLLHCVLNTEAAMLHTTYSNLFPWRKYVCLIQLYSRLFPWVIGLCLYMSCTSNRWQTLYYLNHLNPVYWRICVSTSLIESYIHQLLWCMTTNRGIILSITGCVDGLFLMCGYSLASSKLMTCMI